MWSETKTYGNLVEVTMPVDKVTRKFIMQLLNDNISDSIKYGYLKPAGPLDISEKRGPISTLFGWKLDCLPVSSMESFQYHIGLQFDTWFRNEFNLFDPGIIWKTYLKIKKRILWTRGFKPKHIYFSGGTE